MYNPETGLNIGKVYYIGRVRTTNRLRVKINGYTRYCGDYVNNLYYLHCIEASGIIELKNKYTGQNIRIEGLK